MNGSCIMCSSPYARETTAPGATPYISEKEIRGSIEAGVTLPPCGILKRRMYESVKDSATHIAPVASILAENIGRPFSFLRTGKAPLLCHTAHNTRTLSARETKAEATCAFRFPTVGLPTQVQRVGPRPSQLNSSPSGIYLLHYNAIILTCKA